MKNKKYIKNKSVWQTQFESSIEKGLQNQLISFNQDQTLITYHIQEPYTISFKNPEEPVRAVCFCELVLKYQYPADRIQFEVLTKPDKDRIDILVYQDEEHKDPYLVIECKKNGLSEANFKRAIEQAYRYANYKRAWYLKVMSGNKVRCFDVKNYKSGERQKNIISDIPIRYGEPPKYKYYKQKGKDLNIGSREALINAFQKCHDTIWEGGKLGPTEAFDELSKLLFCKLTDEKTTVKNAAYQCQIGTKETPKDIFMRIDIIYKKAQQENEEIFLGDLQLSQEKLFSCLKHLQEFAINKIDIDSKGLAFETFMKDYFIGKSGQFFTPRNVVFFAIAMMQPDNSMRVLDPACGSGGFLLNTMEYVRKYAEDKSINPLEIYDHWNGFGKNQLFGIEINEKIARVCQMNMILHAASPSNIINTNSLETLEHIASLNQKFRKNYFDLILTNPPFGTEGSPKEESLKSYILVNNKNKLREDQFIQSLFIERCVNFLKTGGRMAIVLPDGILNNSSSQYIRDYLLAMCEILAVISLPQKTFVPYGANVKTSLLFVRKKRNSSSEEKAGSPKAGASSDHYPIFMAIAEHIGYDAAGRETPDQNDLLEILKQYKKFEKGSWKVGRSVEAFEDKNKSFLINRDKLQGRIDPHYYKPELMNNYYKIRSQPHRPLGKLTDFAGETWNQKDNWIHKFPYIEIGGINIKTGEINNISEMKITNAPKSAKRVVREKDILISKTRPNRGAICLIDKNFDGFIASTGFAVVRKIKKINRKYLFYALRLPSTLKQFEQLSSGTTYPTITKSALGKILVPCPPKETQTQIVVLMDRACALHKEKNTEAERLLNFLENTVLKQLNKDFSVGLFQGKLKDKIFILMSQHMKGQRLDVEYHRFQSSQFFTQLKNPKIIQKFIVDYKKGIEVGSDQYVRHGIPFVRVSDIHDWNLQQTKKKISESLFKELKEKFSPKTGELLYTKDGTIGLSFVVTQEENYIISGAFLRLICKNVEDAKFLEIILSLKVYKELVKKESSGSTIQHLNVKNFLKIPIPFPEKNKRDKIIIEVDEIKTKVKSLKKEATKILQKTQQEVETILFNKADEGPPLSPPISWSISRGSPKKR